jgi:hypothetical protein
MPRRSVCGLSSSRRRDGIGGQKVTAVGTDQARRHPSVTGDRQLSGKRESRLPNVPWGGVAEYLKVSRGPWDRLTDMA